MMPFEALAQTVRHYLGLRGFGRDTYSKSDQERRSFEYHEAA